MKLLNIIALITLFSTGVMAGDPALLKEEIKIESFSSQVIPLPHVSYVGRLELRVKRAGNLFNDKDGVMRILADGVEVDCIQFFSTTSRKWRSFIINVNRTVRTIEIYNGLDRKVKIKQITKLPSAHYGRIFYGNPSEVLDITSQIVDVTSQLEHMVTATEIPSIVAIRMSASDLMNKVQVLGPLKVTEEISVLLTLFTKNQNLIEKLAQNQLTADFANELSFTETALKRLIE